jgi:signal recognition particle GTPase
MRDGLRLVEQSLLEADVSYSVVKDFMAEVSQRRSAKRCFWRWIPASRWWGSSTRN